MTTNQVPRKSYDKFHGDIFPDTAGAVPSIGPQHWLAGENDAPATISLGTWILLSICPKTLHKIYCKDLYFNFAFA